ncbi:MAG: hypothetical protein LBJ63_09495 [Prevotellaceae bacterium]|jgi:hypothetical protein|nr:hypothetical protein [Prevotellaceae bacterium]
MKKILLITLVALLGIATANAQIAKGTTVLIASASGLDLSHESNDGTKTTSFGLTGTGAHFVIDNLAIVGGLGFSYGKVTDRPSSTAFGLALGARYYFVKTAYGSVLYRGEKAKGVDFASYANLEVGYDIFISDKVFLEPAVYYDKGFSKGVKKVSTFGLSFGIGIVL